MPRIVVYASLDYEGRMAIRVAKDAAVILAREYGVPVDVEIVEVPASGEEARAHGLPIVYIDGRRISEGVVPAISDLVDEVFKSISEGVESLYGFPVLAVGQEA